MDRTQIEVVHTITGFGVVALSEHRQGRNKKEGDSQGKFFHAIHSEAITLNCGAERACYTKMHSSVKFLGSGLVVIQIKTGTDTSIGV